MESVVVSLIGAQLEYLKNDVMIIDLQLSISNSIFSSKYA